MTLVGKILVVVNFLLSLATGAFIVAVYSNHTKWHVAFDQLNEKFRAVQNNAATYRDEVEKVRGQAQAEQQELAGQMAKLQKDLSRKDEDLAAAQKVLEGEKIKTQLANADKTALTEETNRRRVENERLQALVTEREKRLVELQQQNKRYEDEAVAAKIARDSEHDRNVQLLALNEELTQQNEQLRARAGAVSAGAASTTAQKPPPEDVEGSVTASDPRSGLVTISIGSDSGILKGHALEVFRLEPQPKYLGTIRVIDSRFHEAVGRVTTPMRGGNEIKKGDLVATHLAGAGSR